MKPYFFKTLASLFLFLTLLSCKEDKKKETETVKQEPTLAYATELAQKFIITDGHIDVPYRIMDTELKWIDISKNTSPEGDFDYVRAKEGGLDAPFMSIYIPAKFQKTKGASKKYADELIDLVESIEAKFPDKFKIVTSPSEAEEVIKEGKIAFPLGMENGSPIGDDLANVAYFHKRGIRYITLTHSKDNLICDSSYDDTRTWNGLSDFGKKVVQEMNKTGIMVDVSHISDSTFYQVMKLTKTPVIASHSSCRHFTEGFERNMNDDMIKLLGKNNGVIQINFGSTFLDKALQDARDERRDKWSEIQKTIDKNDKEALAKAQEDFDKNHPKQYSTVQKVADHIDHVVQLAGIDHVGIGSDFDGVGDSLPEGIKDVSEYPNLIFELLKRGYSEEAIEKICYKNVWRVWNAVENFAKAN